MDKVLQKIRSEGHSKVMAVTKFVPLDWQSVHCEALKTRKTDTVIIRITKVD